jgi:hypothetical protein
MVCFVRFHHRFRSAAFDMGEDINDMAEGVENSCIIRRSWLG